ncbi:MAG: tRNA uridine-5-carboxymethylaminomethyl(34) synthesis GTPase MnmE [Candidatus Tumulicola sp.]
MRNDDDTIAAVATPPGKGAIAIVRVSGSRVRAIAQRLVRTRSALQPRLAAQAAVLDETGQVVDRGLALFFPRPASYTGEDLLELHVHGSPIVVREIVRALLACGARHAQAGEFTRRAFLNGKLDLHEADAIADVIEAETRSAARAALANLGGGLAGEVRALRAGLAAVLEDLAAAIDFPEEVPDPDPARLDGRLATVVADLERLRRDGERGRLVREGVHVAIVGPPNAGKSSLLNALLGEERAIVSEVAGTTRDTIEESIAIAGVMVRLVDTAGIRAHAGRLESAGIDRTRRALAAARIPVVVIDGSQELGPEARTILAETRERERVLFFNKADLGDAGARELGDPAAIVGSAWDAASLEALRAAIARVGWGGELPDLERPHLAALREFDAVNEALDALARARATLAAGEPNDFIVGELQRAFSALGHVSEPTAAEEVLDGVFARFCVGK